MRWDLCSHGCLLSSLGELNKGWTWLRQPARNWRRAGGGRDNGRCPVCVGGDRGQVLPHFLLQAFQLLLGFSHAGPAQAPSHSEETLSPPATHSQRPSHPVWHFNTGQSPLLPPFTLCLVPIKTPTLWIRCLFFFFSCTKPFERFDFNTILFLKFNNYLVWFTTGYNFSEIIGTNGKKVS